MRFSAAVVTYTQQHEFRRPRKTLWSQFTIRHYDGANVICHRVMQKQGGVMFDVELDRMVLLCTKRMPRGLGGEGGGGAERNATCAVHAVQLVQRSTVGMVCRRRSNERCSWATQGEGAGRRTGGMRV